MYSFISIRSRLALYSFGVLFIFFYMVFWVNQKVYAEDVPWTSVSNEGERVLFQEQSLYSNDLRGEDLVSPSFEGVNPRILTYRIDTYEGQSGSPVYHYFDTGVRIIAIHTRGNKNMNSGNRITDDVFNNIKNIV
ncbi:trypsin-like serine peptidase [Bacillus cereus]|uniref:Serine protease n=1 Tax=Bacillus cereus HuA4-10 TaxID=1053206 RepID=J8DGD6_BACCE|nr:hypothetical protein IGC_04691 [Bacillus cereus HuA4-10]